MVPGEVIRGGISEEGRGSGRSPEVFRSCDTQAWPAGPVRPALRAALDP